MVDMDMDDFDEPKEDAALLVEEAFVKECDSHAYSEPRLINPTTKAYELAPYALGLVALILTSALIGVLAAQGQRSISLSDASLSAFTSVSPLANTHNSTLGFCEIFSIGLPDRTHKRDAQLLAASYTGFSITPMRGILASEIPESQIPPESKMTSLAP